MDAVIANLTDFILSKINKLMSASDTKLDRLAANLDFRLNRLECKNKDLDVGAASGGGFTSAKQVAYIHKCATDNIRGHLLSPPPHPHNRTDTALPSDTHEWGIAGNLIQRPAPPTVAANSDRPDAEMLPPDALSTMDQDAPPATRMLAASAHNPNLSASHLPDPQPLPRPTYATKATAQNSWKTIPPQKNKAIQGKAKQTAQNTTTANQPSQPAPNKPPTPKPAPRPETLRTEITVQHPPGSIVTNLPDVSLICRRIVAALRAAKSELPLLSG